MKQNGGTPFLSQAKIGQPQGSFIHQNLVSAYKTSPIMPYQVCRTHLVNKLYTKSFVKKGFRFIDLS